MSNQSSGISQGQSTSITDPYHPFTSFHSVILAIEDGEENQKVSHLDKTAQVLYQHSQLDLRQRYTPRLTSLFVHVFDFLIRLLI